MTTFGKAKGGGRRKAARDPAPLLAVLSTLTCDRHVGLVNVSRGGARLQAPDLPAPGEDVMLNAGGIKCFGRVAWSEGRQCGIEFEAPIGAEQVERLQVGIR
jgi:PilZ domain